MEDLWLTWAKRLQGIASTGIHFSRDQYDKERYTEVASIAHQMLATLASVPVSRIQGLVSEFAKGYATPKVDVRGALFSDDKILLVKEASDGCWSLPGGFADIGKSASENIEKEILEEATLKVKAKALYGIRHKAKHDYDPDARDFYKLFFLCERMDAADPMPGLETSQVNFFGRDELPLLSKGRTVEADIVAAFAFKEDPGALALFD
jgi:ADP-ribose pyrophosphatase YjhB (NUDIX family)